MRYRVMSLKESAYHSLGLHWLWSLLDLLLDAPLHRTLHLSRGGGVPGFIPATAAAGWSQETLPVHR